LIRAFVDGLFARGAKRVVIDPDPANARAIRAYKNAGFESFDTRTSVYGAALMLARDAPSLTSTS
jgi:aminoglycoside 6'-N-acetyltransferase